MISKLQQIDLYPEKVRLSLDWLDFHAVLKILGAWGLVLLLASGWFGSQWGYAKYKNAKSLEKLTVMKNEYDEFIKKTRKPTLDTTLPKKIENLNSEYKGKQKMYRYLTKQDIGLNTGFSGFLRSLSKSHITGTWFNHIVIANNGKTMQLYGGSIDASLVPLYLQTLEKEKPFMNTEFEHVMMERDTADQRIVKFVLDTSIPQAILDAAKINEEPQINNPAMEKYNIEAEVLDSLKLNFKPETGIPET